MTRDMETCIEFPGAKDRKGYGSLTKGGKRWKAHRLAFFEAHGYLPSQVCHTCDNPPCTSEYHLFPGTNRDNVDDMMAKGRQVRGEKNGRAKLTGGEVAEIRAEYANGVLTQGMLADVYGVSQFVVSTVVSRKRWN
jgi:hypothetical protein